MKKTLLLSILVASSFLTATNPPALLNKFIGMDKIEDIKNQAVFNKVGENPDIELDTASIYVPNEKEMEILAHIKDKNYNEAIRSMFLDYQQKLKSEEEAFSKATEVSASILELALNEKREDTVLTISNLEEENFIIETNTLYFIDFDNGKVYSKEMEEYTQEEPLDLYSIYWIRNMNKIIVQEPEVINDSTNRNYYLNVTEDTFELRVMEELFEVLSTNESLPRFNFDVEKMTELEVF